MLEQQNRIFGCETRPRQCGYISMNHLLIMEKAENATTRTLTTALIAIEENNIARIYKEYLKTKVT